MALLLTVATGAWAQDPDPIDLANLPLKLTHNLRIYKK